MRYKAVLFDLDGTLIDTSNLIIKSFQHTFKHHYNRDLEPIEVINFFGKPLKDAMIYLGPDRVDDLIKTYREFNLVHHDNLTTAFQGVAEIIRSLYDAGILLAIVTSKTQGTALRGLKLFNMDKYFKVIIGVEQCNHHKPHPEPVLTALTELNCIPEDCLMVGDSPFDIISAKTAGVKTAAVKWTHVPWHTIIKEEPDYILHTIEDLLKVTGI